MTEKILIIDDDENLLSALRRQFRKRFDLHTAQGGDKAIELVKEAGPFAVVLCDMQMPGKNGVEVLGELKKLTPDTVRMMLTGNADQQTAVEAINKGDIFRFFTKPCPNETLATGLESALRQHQMVTAEKELLQKTLAGSVKVLMDVLSMIDPDVFGRATKLREWGQSMAEQMKLPKRWQLDMGIMLCRIGTAAIPVEIQKKMKDRQELTPMEQEMVREVPKTSRKWIGNIPRLQRVAEIVYYQSKGFDGSGYPDDEELSGAELPMESRIIKVLNDLAEVAPDMNPGKDSFKLLADRGDQYDPAVLAAAQKCLVRDRSSEDVEEQLVVMDIPASLLMAGYRLLTDIETKCGQLVLAKDQTVSDAQLTKIRNLTKSLGIREPIRVQKPSASAV